jgi:hypothetical protein
VSDISYVGHKSASPTEHHFGVNFEETREAILMLDGPLTQALSLSVISDPIAQLPQAVPETSPASIN